MAKARREKPKQRRMVKDTVFGFVEAVTTGADIRRLRGVTIANRGCDRNRILDASMGTIEREIAEEMVTSATREEGGR